MEYYSGLDVSLKETFISIIDKNGKIIKEGSVPSEPELIAKYLEGIGQQSIGIESGQLSISLCKSLRQKGLDVVCVDARHMASALSARINKNDRNDARGIAQMMRAGLYKEVRVKSDESCDLKVLLGSRRQLVGNRQEIIWTIRGLLKIYGIKIGLSSASGKFNDKVRKLIKQIEDIGRISILALVSSVEAIEESIDQLDKKLMEIGKKDQDCKLLMTVPGVGIITGITYKTSIDDPGRFKQSETVGAYMGLTPRQYASGEIDRHGSISKMGPKECRTMLYEAAQSLLFVSKVSCKIKSWGLKLAKKKGKKKAAVAVAMKLSVVMHRMLVDRTEFCSK